MNGNIKSMLSGEVHVYCEQVYAGAKLCAQIIFQKQYLLLLKAIIKQEKCKVLLFPEGEEYMIAFIYKYPFVELLINEIVQRSKKDTPNVFEIWATGKLFGYSDYEISKYLKKMNISR